MGWLKHDITNRGITAWLLSFGLLAFYVVLYFGGSGSWNKGKLTQFHKLTFTSSFTWLMLGLLAGILVFSLQVAKRESEGDVSSLGWLDAFVDLFKVILSGYLLVAFLPPTKAKYSASLALLFPIMLGCLDIVLLFTRIGMEEAKAKAAWKRNFLSINIILGIYWALSAFAFPHLANVAIYIILAAIPLLAITLRLVGYVLLLLKAGASEGQRDVVHQTILYVTLLAAVYLLPWIFKFLNIKQDPVYTLASMLRGGVLLWFFAFFAVFGLVSWGILYTHREHGKGVAQKIWILAGIMTALYAVAIFVMPLKGLNKSFYLPGKWMLYGLLYTVCIGIGGTYVIWKYRHNRYQIVRTSVVIFVQIAFAFTIPMWLKLIGKPDYYFSYIWPLKIDYFYPSTIAYQIKNGLPVPVLFYSFVMGLVMAPVLGIVFGKRWYCSWVCGCGGLANTLGEPWRHLSSKSATSWKIEKFSIHAVLVFTLMTTAVTLLGGLLPKDPTISAIGANFRSLYGVGVTAVLSGVVGVGLYPIGGTRVWCRFACPMAALLGLVQKFGRYRIRVKRDMCISCGMCSKYCEMGIDVRQYAQANQTFTRASCVGCGLCAEVCPRGVLRLENVSKKDPQELSLVDIMEGWKGEDISIQSRH
jgi:Pyruvate/2-oxoacid:ferredoxin oxidoreductase delta subunit